MNREVPHVPHAKCDICGKQGAYDFMGDYICSVCLEKSPDPDKKETRR